MPSRPVLRGSALLAVVAAAVLVPLVSPEPAGAVTTAQPVTSAFSVIDSVGVNVHLYYDDTSYADTDRVVDLLSDLGVRHVRDGLAANRPDDVAALQQLGAAGIRSTLLLSGSPGPAVDPSQIAELDQVAPYVDAVEPTNEYDCSGDPAWAFDLHTYAQSLVQTLQGSSHPGARRSGTGILSPRVGRRVRVGDRHGIRDERARLQRRPGAGARARGTPAVLVGHRGPWAAEGSHRDRLSERARVRPVRGHGGDGRRLHRPHAARRATTRHRPHVPVRAAGRATRARAARSRTALRLGTRGRDGQTGLHRGAQPAHRSRPGAARVGAAGRPGTRACRDGAGWRQPAPLAGRHGPVRRRADRRTVARGPAGEHHDPRPDEQPHAHSPALGGRPRHGDPTPAVGHQQRGRARHRHRVRRTGDGPGHARASRRAHRPGRHVVRSASGVHRLAGQLGATAGSTLDPASGWTGTPSATDPPAGLASATRSPPPANRPT